jgi:hypothetical protein
MIDSAVFWQVDWLGSNPWRRDHRAGCWSQRKLNTKNMLAKESEPVVDHKANKTQNQYQLKNHGACSSQRKYRSLRIMSLSFYCIWNLTQKVYRLKNQSQLLITKQTKHKKYTVEPRFKNLIHSWRPFVIQNVRKQKLCVLSKVTQQLTLSCRYSQLVAICCCRLACLLLETPFVTRDIFCSENLFVMKGVCEPRFHCTG